MDYDILPSISDLHAAMDKGGVQVWPEVSHNLAFDWEIGDKAATEAEFAREAHVTKLSIVNNRIVVNSIEARAALADFGRRDRTVDAVCEHPGRVAGEEPDRAGVRHRSGEVPHRHARRGRRVRDEACSCMPNTC